MSRYHVSSIETVALYNRYRQRKLLLAKVRSCQRSCNRRTWTIFSYICSLTFWPFLHILNISMLCPRTRQFWNGLFPWRLNTKKWPSFSWRFRPRSEKFLRQLFQTPSITPKLQEIPSISPKTIIRLVLCYSPKKSRLSKRRARRRKAITNSNDGENIEATKCDDIPTIELEDDSNDDGKMELNTIKNQPSLTIDLTIKDEQDAKSGNTE